MDKAEIRENFLRQSYDNAEIKLRLNYLFKNTSFDDYSEARFNTTQAVNFHNIQSSINDYLWMR